MRRPQQELPALARSAEFINPLRKLRDEPVFQEEFWQGSDRIYIFFGGAFGAFGMKPFEYSRSAKILDYSRIFMSDPYQSWYMRGVPTLGNNVYEVARFLEDRIAASGATEVRFVGNCMGGFAALLFCGLLKTGRAVAFAPQTFLSPEREKFSTDPRGSARLRELYRHHNEHFIYDLKPWLARHRPEIVADIYASTAHEHDLPHAQEMEGFGNIRVHYLPEGGHRVMLYLHQNGLMPGILAQ